MAANVDLCMSFDDIYRPVLSIPVDTCQRFSVHPLAWLRYLGYTIYGNEGYISTSPNGPQVENYHADIVPGNYYYVSQEPFLLDPDGMDDRTSDASTISTSRDDFRDRIATRDRNCVMTGTPFAQASHLIPHAKGNQYIINLANNRNELLDPPLEDINDTRNGILLAVQLHRSFGASHVAFLHTPNFAMSVKDVDLVTQPTAGHLDFSTPPSDANTRLTLQHFNTDDFLLAHVAPHNSDARQSDDSEWPPALIFDVAYGCATLKAWGVIGFVQFARQRTRNIYYDFDDDGSGGSGDAGDAGGGRVRNQARNIRKATGRKKARNVGRLARNTEEDQAVDFADMILALWMQNAKKCSRQAHAKKMDSTREKVRTWLESTES